MQSFIFTKNNLLSSSLTTVTVTPETPIFRQPPSSYNLHHRFSTTSTSSLHTPAATQLNQASRYLQSSRQHNNHPPFTTPNHHKPLCKHTPTTTYSTKQVTHGFTPSHNIIINNDEFRFAPPCFLENVHHSNHKCEGIFLTLCILDLPCFDHRIFMLYR